MKQKYNGLEVAVIGMSGRFPGAENVEKYWENISKGVESIEFFDKEALLKEGFSEEELDHPGFVRAGSYVKDKEYFDAAFFQYRDDEAKIMDPQLRLFHEVVWSALENAGYNIHRYAEKVGLFAGANPNINWQLYSALLNQKEGLVDEYSAGHLNNVNFLTNRVSYLLNLKGPSVFVNSTCSTSLASVHMAVGSLLMRECKMAIAGGVTITNVGKGGYMYQDGMINSKDGHCRAFDNQSSGTVGGEGVGVVVLKRLQDAIKDGDHIYAVIKGSAVNNDGNNKIGFTAPSVQGQVDVIKMAHAHAKVPFESIGYLEAHGTGTKLGDPIEIEALNKAYSNLEKGTCALGSVKTNIGHLDAASGIAGFIKTVMTVYNRQIPPSLHFESPNSEIDFEAGPFYVNTELKPWDHKPVLRAGVSSFGIGGTNVHVLLEEPPVREEQSEDSEEKLFTLSAKSEKSLKTAAANLTDYLINNDQISMKDVSFTLNTGRAGFDHRYSFAATSKEDVLEHLKTVSVSVLNAVEKQKVVFMFPGQGSQYAQMSKGLYERYPVFRVNLDECFNLISEYTGRDLKALLFDDDQRNGSVNDTINTQPVLFAVEYALAKQLIALGITPDLMVGHSIGEYVAACISGVFSLKDAVRLVIKRGELIQSAEKGDMLSVALNETDTKKILKNYPGLSIAALNSENSTVVSGEGQLVASLKNHLNEADINYRDLHTSHAFHSEMMDPVLAEFDKLVQDTVVNEPGIPFVSNVTGELFTSIDAENKNYWTEHLRGTVRFYDAHAKLTEEEQTVLLEVGPGNTLGSLVKTTVSGAKTVSLLRHPKKEVKDAGFFLEALGKAWNYGAEINWDEFYKGSDARKIALPTYAFDKKAYPTMVDARKMLAESGHTTPVRKNNANNWLYSKNWKSQPLVATSMAEKTEKTLFITDNSSFAGQFSTEISKIQTAVISSHGEIFKKVSALSFEANFADEQDVKALFNVCELEGTSIDHVVFVRSNDDRSLATFVKSLQCVKKVFGSVRHITLITDAACVVTGYETLSIGSAGISPVLTVLSQEFAGINVKHIDIVTEEAARNGFFTSLFNEINSRQDKNVSLRAGKRWLPEVSSLDPGTQKATAFVQKGSYIITGGLGQLGSELARQLISKYQANVVLTGRTSITNPQTESQRQKADKLEELRKLGNAQYFQVNSNDLAGMTELNACIQKQFGKVDGIIHAAGVLDPHTPFAEITEAGLVRQIAAKSDGLDVFNTLYGGQNDVSFVAISSLSAEIGGLGYGAYAVANRLMDDMLIKISAEREQKNWKTINFDGLTFDGRGSGIKPVEVFNIIEKVMSCPAVDQVLVSVEDLQDRIDNWVNRAGQQLMDDQADELIHSGDFDNQTVNEKLKTVWSGFFSGQEISDSDDFFDLGGDSLKALTMIGRIHRTFSVEVPIEEFFKRTVLRQLAMYIEELQSGDTCAFEPIMSAPVADSYPLSSAQSRLYYIYQLDKESTAYNLPKTMKLEGNLSVERLEKAFTELIIRHEPLRTTFVMERGVAVQKVNSDFDFKVEKFKATGDEIAGIFNAFVRPFDLEKDTLLRVAVIETGNDEFVMLIDMHHIITDGVSYGIFVNDFMSIYQGVIPDTPALQYKDYAVWQNHEDRKDKMRSQKEFWLDLYADVPSVLELPTDHRRPLQKQFEGDVVRMEIDESLTSKLNELAEKEGTTLYNVMLSTLNILFGKLGNTEDLVIGSGISSREHPDLENVLGMFVNILPIRNNPVGTQTFSEFLQSVKERSLSCFNNQAYPYDSLIDEIRLERDAGRNPLFDIVFTWQNFDNTELKMPGIVLKPFEMIQNSSKFDITVDATEFNDKIELGFEYDTALFEQQTVKRFVSYYREILSAITENAEVLLSDISLLSESEINQQLHDFNDTHFEYPREAMLQDYLKQSVNQYAEKPAIVHNDQEISYVELDEKTTKVAAALVQRGVKPGERIGILVNRSVNTIITMLSIIKAGAIYVPLDPENPASRLSAIVKDADIKFAFAEGEVSDMVRNLVKIVRLEEMNNDASTLPVSEVSSSDPVYIMYTSGTTGIPKGVIINHYNVARLVIGQEYLKLGADTRLLLTGAMFFDQTTIEIWGSIVNGGTLYLIDKDDLLDTERLTEKVRRHDINTMMLTTSLFRHHVETDMTMFAQLRYFLVGGDVLSPYHINKVTEKYPALTVFNVYGPTENTALSTFYKLEGKYEASVPIGKPITNSTAYVLDEYRKMVPVGVTGELCVGGPGLAEGYLNRDELTAEKFIRNPYAKEEMIYRTGDLVRWLPDGNIDFIGRKDKQVKIRGYRIELNGIEECLSQFTAVSDCAALVIDNGDQKMIVGYYVAKDKIPVDALIKHLSTKLPDYMIPSYFMHMESLPKTRNGKLDKKAFPVPELNAHFEYEPAANNIEAELVKMWSEILNIDEKSVGVTVNFFDIGGNSLSAIKLLNKIEVIFAKNFTLKQLFEVPTIRELSVLLQVGMENQTDTSESIEQDEITI